MTKKNSRFLHGLASLVAAGSSVRAAAAETGCSERQGYALASTAEFRELVSRLQTEAVQRASAILADNATAAATAIANLLESEDEKVRLAAAVKLLAAIQPMQEFAELRDRIEKLERQPLRIAK
tara:strand:- start:562 stop:933 length:372 start_codon:yes stop_codon:yes gene_type:complete